MVLKPAAQTSLSARELADIARAAGQPPGDYKQSGIGRELGRWGLEGYLETKQITRCHSAEPWGWYLG